MLLNYTTTITAERTASEMARLLAAAGARQVLTDYEGGRPVGLAFALDTVHGVRQYRLPVRSMAVLKVLRNDGVPRRYQTAEQAEKVAWRILKDWLKAQLALIATEMVDTAEVFLPYMLVGTDTTVYAAFLDQTLALEAGR